MTRNIVPRRFCLTWRVFSRHDGAVIERQVRMGRMPRCPCCRELLEARPQTRLRYELPLDASGYDLDCRDCRRFWCVVRHTTRSLRLLRMRRLAAAVRSVPVQISAAPAAGAAV